MHPDVDNEYRPFLESDPPKFVDRVDTPWSKVPDLPEYNGLAYRRIVRALKQLQAAQHEADGNYSRGILVLGEAGTGKTHLLMRVANNLSDSNHILFVRKPNNEEAVAQHVWSNIVSSLARTVASSAGEGSQLDDLLAHVFSKVLVAEFEEDIQEGVDVSQRRRWVELLRETPFNIFRMLGQGERRSSNMKAIRRRTLRYLQTHHPEVDQRIAHVLITYCFVAREERKRMLLTWLSGQDIEESEADMLGLPVSWIEAEERETDTSVGQQREEYALRAIRTVAMLSSYYQPLILAFDQLEGLRDEDRLTRRWGDVVREIFTMAPNMLVVTCIFPSLWEGWFLHKLDSSVTERISQSQITLEQFGPKHGARMLETHLSESFAKHRLPTNIYPFVEADVVKLCRHATSARLFVQNAKEAIEDWLDEGDALETVWAGDEDSQVLTQEGIDSCLRSRLQQFEEAQRSAYFQDIPIEEDFFGRIRNIVKTLIDSSPPTCRVQRAKLGTRVMPPNIVVSPESEGTSLCIAVMHRSGNAFAARLKNLRTLRGPQFDDLIVIRDKRCSSLGPKCRQYVEDIQVEGMSYIHADIDEVSIINSIYDVLVAIEEHDVAIRSWEISKHQFTEFLRANRICRKAQLFRQAANRSKALHQATWDSELPDVARSNSLEGGKPTREAIEAEAHDDSREPQEGRDRGFRNSSDHDAGSRRPQKDESGRATSLSETPSRSSKHNRGRNQGPPRPSLPVDVVVGDTDTDSTHIGILGTLTSGRRLGISLSKPQCLAILGYMGSGKSYALGVLIENTLLKVPNLTMHSRPLTVVAFNYRRNSESRFEYGGYTHENADHSEVRKLVTEYAAAPVGVSEVNVLAFAPEIPRRQHEYTGLKQHPIQFVADELNAEHWEILMKPPTPQAEYMDIIRDVIQELYYKDKLTYVNLERKILDDERLSDMQRRRAQNRLSFARRWISDDRRYNWSDLLTEGALNIVDLRMQTLESSDALKLCLIITDLVRRTRNGVNKVIVFDEAHEYVDSKQLIAELENAVTQIRHDGLSFVLASQFPDRIPERIFKYLLTRLVFKLPHAKGVNYLRKMAANLDSLSAVQLSNLDLEQGVCLIQTDDDCSDIALQRPQKLHVRPRCSHHGGATIRQEVVSVEADGGPVDSLYGNSQQGDNDEPTTDETQSSGVPHDSQKTLAELNDEFGISWNRFLKLLGLPADCRVTPDMTLEEARSRVGK